MSSANSGLIGCVNKGTFSRYEFNLVRPISRESYNVWEGYNFGEA
jgi:hypothetical protein